MRTWAAPRAAFAARLHCRRGRQRRQGRLLQREPPGVDRRVLGLSADRRGRRADRLPLVARLSRARRRIVAAQRGARRPGRSADARAAATRRCGGCTSSTGVPAGTPPPVTIARDDVAEIIFTSGATAEPKGVVITHRNVLANIVPVEREVLKYRKYANAVLPDPVPEPAAAQPHVRPGDGDLRSADADGRRRVHARLQPGRHRRADQDAAGLGAGVGAEDSRRAARARAAATPTAKMPARRARLDSRAAAFRALTRIAGRWWHHRDVHRLFGAEVLGVRRRRRAARRRAREVLGRARVCRRAGLRPHRNGADRHAEPSVRHADADRSARPSPAWR